MTYIQRVASTLAPLSIEQDDMATMLREWHYTGNTYDLGEPLEDCELCGHPDIRYQFEIANRHTGHELLIGSECITRFDIPAVDEEGRLLDSAATREKVHRDRRKLITDAQKKRVIRALLQLAAADAQFEINSFIDYYQNRGAFTPNQLALLVWRFGKHKISYHKSDLKMAIKRNREKDQLRDMEDWKIKQIWECMSPTQKSWYAEHVNPSE